MSVTLLENGAAHADGIDLSPMSVATAQRRADAAGVGDRATFMGCICSGLRFSQALSSTII